MAEIPLTVRSSTAAIARLTRPAIVQDDPLAFWNDQLYATLQAQGGGRYRDTPIYTDAGSVISHYWDQPIVAGRTMCAVPTTDLGYNYPSPNALIRDRWHDLAITATSSIHLTEGSPTDDLDIEPLDRALEAGFVIGFGYPEYVLLTADAAIGATTISVQRIYADVTVDPDDVGEANNGYFFQRGCGCPRLSDLNLAADPYPLMDNPRFNEATRKYACDGIAVSAMGAQLSGIRVFNFPGHGLWSASPSASSTLSQRQSMWDFWEPRITDATILNCLAGATLNGTDTQFGTIVGAGCRDYGLRMKGYNIQGGTVHTWGCGIGTWMSNGGHITDLESENCDYGVQIDYKSDIGSMNVYGNHYRGVYIDGFNLQIGSMYIQHASSDTSADSQPTGYALVIRAADRLNCPNVIVDATDGGQGVVLGNGQPILKCQLAGAIGGYTLNSGPGAKGLHIKASSIKGSTFNFAVNDFADCVYFEHMNDLANVKGNQIHFSGITSNTILWPNDATGTFGTPAIPTALSDTNTIAFHVY